MKNLNGLPSADHEKAVFFTNLNKFCQNINVFHLPGAKITEKTPNFPYLLKFASLPVEICQSDSLFENRSTGKLAKTGKQKI